MDDDGSGWNEILLAVWSSEVCDAVSRRIDSATVGRRGWLVRALTNPDGGHSGWTETVHALIVAAIRDETGADLDALGSQAAWECYEQVWADLEARWSSGGMMTAVSLRVEPEVSQLIRQLPPAVAAYAGADVTGIEPDPLWLNGRLLVDTEGLHAYLALAGARIAPDLRARIHCILQRSGA